MKKGKLYLAISAFIYGLTPVLAKFAYRGGINSITITFLRSFLCLPVLYLIMRVKKISLKISKKELIKILNLGVFGNAFMLICLYSSYDFISVGLATVIHYIYPVLIVFVCVAVFGEKLKRRTIFSSIIITIGIMMFAKDSEGGSITGVILSLLAGSLFAFNVIYLDKSGLDKMNYLKLTFYLSIIMSVTTLFLALFSNALTFDIAPYSWIISILISALVTLVALPLFQLGILKEGAAEAGILSTIEPISSVLLGAIFLNEPLTIFSITGCGLIVLGITLTESKK